MAVVVAVVVVAVVAVVVAAVAVIACLQALDELYRHIIRAVDERLLRTREIEFMQRRLADKPPQSRMGVVGDEGEGLGERRRVEHFPRLA